MMLRTGTALLAAFVSSAALAVPPASVSASYDVTRDGLPVATVQESFEQSGDQYRLVSESNPAGLLAMVVRTRITIHSSGAITDTGLRPEQFNYGRIDDPSKNVSAEFDWNAHQLQMSFEGRHATAPLEPGTQDRLSAMYQFMFLPAAPSAEFAFPMTNGKKVEHYRYQPAGSEQIQTPIGSFDTLRLVKEREADDNGVEVWLARNRNLFPVRLVIVEKDGTRYEQTITRLEMR